MNKNAKHVFETHKTVHVLYETSDGMLFRVESGAQSHTNDLKDKTITPITRAEAFADLGDVEDVDSSPVEDSESSVAKKPTVKNTLTEIHAYMDGLGIEYGEEQKAELIEKIAAAGAE